MKTYTFWNNKGGTGKTTLCFQTLVSYAYSHSQERVLVVDLCPQANLSELLVGGICNNGAANLAQLYNAQNHRSIGGYFDCRMLSPYMVPANLNPSDFISTPHQVNNNIPDNVDLIAGDAMVELQTVAISSLASTTMPNIDAFATVLTWLRDLLNMVQGDYDVVFIDTNPSFSIYTEIALAATNFLIIPATADDASRRALENVVALVYGLNVPQGYNSINMFYNVMSRANYPMPKIHLVLKNRLTQYMGTAVGYKAVLNSINSISSNLRQSNPNYFTNNFQIMDIRDFQTAGVVAMAESKYIRQLDNEPATHVICNQSVQVDKGRVRLCSDEIDAIVNNL